MCGIYRSMEGAELRAVTCPNQFLYILKSTGRFAEALPNPKSPELIHRLVKHGDGGCTVAKHVSYFCHGSLCFTKWLCKVAKLKEVVQARSQRSTKCRFGSRLGKVRVAVQGRQCAAILHSVAAKVYEARKHCEGPTVDLRSWPSAAEALYHCLSLYHRQLTNPKKLNQRPHNCACDALTTEL